jgi:hypothetical protein
MLFEHTSPFTPKSGLRCFLDLCIDERPPSPTGLVFR